jgi:peroxiredoxin
MTATFALARLSIEGRLRYSSAMAATPSAMLALGTRLPKFSLIDTVSSKPVSEATLWGKVGVLVAFICNHCPYVIHIRREFAKVAHEALDANLAVIAINSNSEESHPQDGPGPMQELARAEGWRFPYLFDASQDVARAFDAACTPDIFLFNGEHELVYRGQFDDSRPSNGKPVTGADLRRAIASVVAKEPVSAEQKPSIGCNIKWKT